MKPVALMTTPLIIGLPLFQMNHILMPSKHCTLSALSLLTTSKELPPPPSRNMKRNWLAQPSVYALQLCTSSSDRNTFKCSHP